MCSLKLILGTNSRIKSMCLLQSGSSKKLGISGKLVPLKLPYLVNLLLFYYHLLLYYCCCFGAVERQTSASVFLTQCAHNRKGSCDLSGIYLLQKSYWSLVPNVTVLRDNRAGLERWFSTEDPLALTEYTSSVPSTQVRQLTTICKSNSSQCSILFWPPGPPALMATYIHT